MPPMGLDCFPPFFQCRLLAADADVEITVLLWYIPGIPRQTTIKKPQPALGVCPVERKFFLGRGDQSFWIPRMYIRKKGFINRAMRAAGTYQIGALVFIVYYEPFAGFVYVADMVLINGYTGAFQEKFVKFPTPYGILAGARRNPNAAKVKQKSLVGKKTVGIIPGC